MRLRKNPFGAVRFSISGFLVAMVLLLVGSPILEHMEYGVLVESILMTLVLVSAVLAVGGRRRILFWAVLIVVPTVACRWVYTIWPEKMLPDVYLVSSLVFVAFIIWQL